ncbi:MAG: hypothetical protein HYZ33_00625 [Ignavibacteriales bacterium]|nr:hypothetical protein [Ignavibacteriales bacterium]
MATNSMGTNGESSMMKPEQFYNQQEHTDSESKKRMWQTIRKETKPPSSSLLCIESKRSFFFGIAAAILLYFTSVGIFTTIRQTIENGKPQAIRFSEAYQSAIEDFENVIPQLVSSTAISEKDKSYLQVRKEQLAKIDAAINSFEKEHRGRDVSPLIQQRLRQLYSMKLQVLQQLIDKGEIEL